MASPLNEASHLCSDLSSPSTQRGPCASKPGAHTSILRCQGMIWVFMAISARSWAAVPLPQSAMTISHAQERQILSMRHSRQDSAKTSATIQGLNLAAPYRNAGWRRDHVRVRRNLSHQGLENRCSATADCWPRARTPMLETVEMNPKFKGGVVKDNTFWVTSAAESSPATCVPSASSKGRRRRGA